MGEKFRSFGAGKLFARSLCDVIWWKTRNLPLLNIQYRHRPRSRRKQIFLIKIPSSLWLNNEEKNCHKLEFNEHFSPCCFFSFSPKALSKYSFDEIFSAINLHCEISKLALESFLRGRVNCNCKLFSVRRRQWWCDRGMNAAENSNWKCAMRMTLWENEEENIKHTEQSDVQQTAIPDLCNSIHIDKVNGRSIILMQFSMSLSGYAHCRVRCSAWNWSELHNNSAMQWLKWMHVSRCQVKQGNRLQSKTKNSSKHLHWVAKYIIIIGGAESSSRCGWMTKWKNKKILFLSLTLSTATRLHSHSHFAPAHEVVHKRRFYFYLSYMRNQKEIFEFLFYV